MSETHRYWNSEKQEWVYPDAEPYKPEPGDTQYDLIDALQRRCDGLESERASWRRTAEKLQKQVNELLMVMAAAYGDYEDHNDAGCVAILKTCLRKWGRIP